MNSSRSKSSILTFFKITTLGLMSMFFLSLTPDRPLFTITGTCTENSKPVDGVIVSILIDGGAIAKCTTAADGKYKLRLNFGKLVKVGFVKKGYLNQTVKLRTVLSGISETEMTHIYDFEMISLPNDSSTISFDRSVDEILFDNDTKKFISNSEYKDGVKADFEAVKKMIQEEKK
jgi:hypothetical protein